MMNPLSMLGGLGGAMSPVSSSAAKEKSAPASANNSAQKPATPASAMPKGELSADELKTALIQLLQMLLTLLSAGEAPASAQKADSAKPESTGNQSKAKESQEASKPYYGYENDKPKKSGLMGMMNMLKPNNSDKSGQPYDYPYPENKTPYPENKPQEKPKERVIGSGKKTTKIGNLTIKHSPLTLDMNGDGVKTSNKLTRFDIDGNGSKDSINDISPDDALLTIDADGNGVSGENGKELLGDNTDLSRFGIEGKFKDGFEALNAIADQAKQKGLINQDDTLDGNELKTLEAEYGLKAKKGSLNAENQSAGEAGIKDVNLATGAKTRINNFDGRGNDTLKQEGATFTRTDGRTLGYEDLFFELKA